MSWSARFPSRAARPGKGRSAEVRGGRGRSRAAVGASRPLAGRGRLGNQSGGLIPVPGYYPRGSVPDSVSQMKFGYEEGRTGNCRAMFTTSSIADSAADFSTTRTAVPFSRSLKPVLFKSSIANSAGRRPPRFNITNRNAFCAVKIFNRMRSFPRDQSRQTHGASASPVTDQYCGGPNGVRPPA